MNIKSWIKNKKIGVLYGGQSAEREISLLTGKAVIKALKGLDCKVAGIDAGPELPFHIRKQKIDFAFIALHGLWGEDGTVQGMLEMMNVPYSGCGVLSSALSINKIYTKRIFDSLKLPTPEWKTLNRQDSFKSLNRFPIVVKPATQGSALGVSVVDNSKDLDKALKSAFKHDSQIIFEKYISGTEITVGILGNTVLPVIEIVPANSFYDFKSKYQPGQSKHLIPPRLPEPVIRKTQELALKAFDALGCRALARVDMIVDKKNMPWLLEVNTIPGMTETSLLPDAAGYAGISFNELVLKIIEYSVC